MSTWRRRPRRSWAWSTASRSRRRSSRVRSAPTARSSSWTPGWTGCARSSFEGVSAAPQTGTVEPFRFEDGALLVLDQRALPAEERWIRCETPEQVADCIRTLAVRGAPAIGIAAAYAMALADDPDEAAELLGATRPTAVNLAWALERCHDADDPLDAARRLHQEQRDADRRLAELGVELFGEGTRALTHCNTGA